MDDVPFIRKRQIERELELQYPDYYSKYSLVTFRPEMPYAQAMHQGRQQDKLLLDICAQDNFDQIPLEEYHRRLQNLVAV